MFCPLACNLQNAEELAACHVGHPLIQITTDAGTLGFTFRDVEALLGLPEGYTDIGEGEFSVADKLHILRGEVEPIAQPRTVELS